MKQLDYDSVDWHQEFYYDATSVSGLRYKKPRYSSHGKKLEKAIGDSAGSKQDTKNNGKKAWTIVVWGKQWKVHRIIMCLFGHSVNGYVVDHIDGDSENNSIDNLRICTIAHNSRNCHPQRNCPYGIPGVGFYSDHRQNMYVIARWNEHGKRHQESFPVKTLGLIPAFAMAIEFRLSTIERLNSIGANYTDRHIKI